MHRPRLKFKAYRHKQRRSVRVFLPFYYLKIYRFKRSAKSADPRPLTKLTATVPIEHNKRAVIVSAKV